MYMLLTKIVSFVVILGMFSQARGEDVSLATSAINSHHLAATQAVCNDLNTSSAENSSCKVYLYQGVEDGKMAAAAGVYNFVTIPADQVYARKNSGENFRQKKLNFVMQFYDTTVFLLKHPEGQKKDIRKGEKVGILLLDPRDRATLSNLLDSRGIDMRDVTLSSLKDKTEFYTDACRTKGIDFIFLTGHVKDPMIYGFIAGCGFELVPIPLTPSLLEQYPYYKSRNLDGSAFNMGWGRVRTIASPVIVMSNADTSKYSVAHFIKSVLEKTVPKIKMLQTVGDNASAFLKNVTALPDHQATIAIKRSLKSASAGGQ